MKFCRVYKTTRGKQSPSMRREWIEIVKSSNEYKKFKSPSMRREWIEIFTLRIRQIGF